MISQEELTAWRGATWDAKTVGKHEQNRRIVALIDALESERVYSETLKGLAEVRLARRDEKFERADRMAGKAIDRLTDERDTAYQRGMVEGARQVLAAVEDTWGPVGIHYVDAAREAVARIEKERDLG